MFSSKLQLRHQHCILTFQFRQPKVSHSKNPEIYRLEEKEETNTRKRKRTPENRVEMGKDIITKNHAKSHSIVLSMGLKKSRWGYQRIRDWFLDININDDPIHQPLTIEIEKKTKNRNQNRACSCSNILSKRKISPKSPQ